MAAIQAFLYVIEDVNLRKKFATKKIKLAPKWLVPIVTVILYTAIIVYSLGWNVDMRKVAVVIVAIAVVYSVKTLGNK